MIKIGSKTYSLKGLHSRCFFEKLDEITCGQITNPELSYTTQFFGSFDNVFGGRKKGNSFSIYLYRPITRDMRTEILAKGTVNSEENGLSINVRYEIPFWSILAFLIICVFTFLPVYTYLGLTASVIATGVLLLMYSLILNSNLNDVKKEVLSQFVRFKKVNERM